MKKAYSYIRMSTSKQLRGDSLRRQLEASKEYAVLNNLHLMEELDGRALSDIGISAYQSANAEKGVLGAFLTALDAGKIEIGSVLLIESLDRLSRDKVLVALNQFISILAKGIEIVTLMDKQIYTYDGVSENPAQLYTSLGVMLRANDESKTKSIRSMAVWDSKRKNAGNSPVTAKGPGWLVLNKSTNKFEVIPERGAIVKMIFDMCAHQCGLWSITKHLNESKTPQFGKAKFWQISYVRKILYNRAVLGEYQGFKTIDGLKMPIGDPIINYYPRIIDDDLFYLAQAACTRRKTGGSGPKGKNFGNLFLGFSYCKKCGSKMVVRSVGSKGKTKLMCVQRNLAGICNMPTWKYSFTEALIIQHLIEVNFSELLGKNDQYKYISNKLHSCEAREKELLNKINTALDLILDTSTHPASVKKLQERLAELENQHSLLLAEITEHSLWLQQYQQQLTELDGKEIKEVLKLVKDKTEDIVFRAKLNELLAKIIDRLDFYVDIDYFDPDEVNAEDIYVINYLAKYPRYKNMRLEKLVETKGFKDFYQNYLKRVIVTYKTGQVRQIMIGENASFTYSAQKPSLATKQ